MVPPPVPSLTDEVPLNPLAPTFVPNAPRLSGAGVAKCSLETDTKHNFEDLIVVLSELSTRGGSTPRLSTIFSLWKDRKPGAFEIVGAAQFKTYLQLAESAGIVAVEQRQDGDGWVTLSRQWDANSNSPRQRTSSQQTMSRFRDLIEILNDLRLVGDSEPQFFTVGTRLRRKNPSIYEDAGVMWFEGYVRAVEEAGVVTIRGARSGSLKLCPVYCSSPVGSSTPTGVASTPPTFTDSAALPFAPLVGLLKSQQLVRSQPVSFSEVFAHLVLTHGYAGLVSLCTTIPGVTTFDQYIDAAIDSGLVSLVGGTTTSGSTLVSPTNAGRARGAGLRLSDGPSPPAQRGVSTTLLLPSPSSEEITIPPPLVNDGSSSFLDLAMVLRELQASTGESAFRFSSVIPLLLERKPNAYTSVGVGSFADYVTLAMENGVVTAGWTDQSDGWVMPNDRESPGPAVPVQSSKSWWDVMATVPPPFANGGGVDPQFVDLVRTLGVLWKKGHKRPLLSHVGSELFKVGWRTTMLNACGVSDFQAFAKLAKDAGIVEIHGRGGKQKMSLDPTIRVTAGYA